VSNRINGSIRVDCQIHARRERSLQRDIGDSRWCAYRSSRCRECFSWQIPGGQNECARADYAAQEIAAALAHLVCTERDIFYSNHEGLRFFGDFRTLILPLIRFFATQSCGYCLPQMPRALRKSTSCAT